MCRTESSFKLIIHKSSFLKQNLGWQIPKLSHNILKPECCLVTCPNIDMELRLLAQKEVPEKGTNAKGNPYGDSLRATLTL